MTDLIFELALISIIVTIDNALLAGILLPQTSGKHKKEIIIVVGVALGVTQIIMAIGVDELLTDTIFRILAILILTWMSIRTLIDIPTVTQDFKKLSMWKVFVYTAFGNLDNMIWLGSEMDGEHFWLVFFSLATIPLFILIAIFLSNQCERHHWILMVGAGMMAWAAASLIVETPGWRIIDNYIALPVPQVLICLFILIIGFIIRGFTVHSG